MQEAINDPGFSAVITMLGGAYIFARGMDNIVKGLRSPPAFLTEKQI